MLEPLLPVVHGCDYNFVSDLSYVLMERFPMDLEQLISRMNTHKERFSLRSVGYLFECLVQ